MRGQIVAAVLLCAAAFPAIAQSSDGPARPTLLAAMGLLETEEVVVRHPDWPDFSITVPSSEEVKVARSEVPPEQGDVLAAWEFYVEDEGVIETLVISGARIDTAERETRRFAMANLLVLRSYAEIARTFPGAELIGFGPLAREDDLSAVQTAGSFQVPEGGRFVFRHVGLMEEGREEALVAIANIDQRRMPLRTDAELLDTYSGVMLDSLRFIPEEEGAPTAE